MTLSYLSRDNRNLKRLELAYQSLPFFDTLLGGSAWQTFERGLNLQQFRGEAQYLTQLILGATPEQYAVTFDYVRSIDTEGYLTTLKEDGDFGCITFERDGIIYSRDLLDSIIEIAFLRRHLGWTATTRLNILDIGSGYGRFAHRVHEAFVHANIYCTDAVPVST